MLIANLAIATSQAQRPTIDLPPFP